MANEVKIRVKIDDKGNLKVLAKEAKGAATATDKLAKSTDRASKSNDRYHKGAKGVGGLTNNSTKAFTKQAGAMGGSSGLVAAYATLAANVFALSAAFGVLQRNASFEQLQQGLIFTGQAAGTNLPLVAKNLKDITDSAISTADAMKAVAIGTSAGFDTAQLEGLTSVAKGASLALGRDMTDALDRLVRGAAKLEPEILDELGIMVRLDEVTQNYADSVNKSASSVTAFEKRMAFTNAIIEQGEAKFAALNTVIDVNPYSQLASQFDALVKSALKVFEVFAGPIVSAISTNLLTLAGAVGIFAINVVKAMVPALSAGGAAAAEMSKRHSELAKATIGSSKAIKGGPKAYNELVKKMQAGTATSEDMKKAQASLTKSLKVHNAQIDKQPDKYAKNSAALEVKEAKVKEVQLALNNLTAAQKLETKATLDASRADVLNTASRGGLLATIQALRIQIALETAQIKLNAAAKSGLSAVNAILSGSFNLLAFSIKAVGLALINAIPLIGTVILLGGLVLDWAKKFFKKPPTALEEGFKKTRQVLDTFPDIIDQLADSYALATTNAERFEKSLRAQSGILSSVSVEMRKQVSTQENSIKAEVALAQAALNRAKIAQEGVGSAGGDQPTDARSKYNPRARAMKRTPAQDAKAAVTAAEAALDAAIAKQVDYNGAAANQVVILYETISALETIQAFQNEGTEEYGNTENALKTLRETLTEIESGTLSIKASTELATNAAIALSKEQKEIVNALEQSKSISQDLTSNFNKQVTITGAVADEITAMKSGLEALGNLNENSLVWDRYAEAFGKYDIKTKAGLKSQISLLEAQVNEQMELDVRTAQSKSLSGQSLQVENDRLKVKQASLDLSIAENRLKTLGASLEDGSLEKNKLKSAVAIAEANKRAAMMQEKVNDLNRASLASRKEINKALENAAGITGAGGDEIRAGINAQLIGNEIARKQAEMDLRAGENKDGVLSATNEQLKQEVDILKVKQDSLRIDERAAGGKKILESAGKFGEFGQGVQASGNALIDVASESLKRKDTDNPMKTSEMLSGMNEAMSPMMQNLASLGPDGALMSAVLEGAMSMGTALTAAFEEGGSGAEKGLAIAGAALGAMQSISAATTNKQVSGIDKQIAAEKKRDGKSKESLAKIAAMEKKKEALKKKQFEKDKKMQMANIAISTATGVIGVWSGVKDPYAGPTLAGLAAGLILATGAASMAAVAGSTYDGGGSISSAGGGTKGPVSVGERKNSVDLASSKGAVGELGYMRGGSGTGNANNFKPAFTGARYRAAGGSVGYMVGEQGPELFMPEVPGNIVPAGETETIQGGTTNLNFSITAFDAAGVEEVLSGQRGNIIRMIRETANDAGEGFLEGVEERY